MRERILRLIISLFLILLAGKAGAQVRVLQLDSTASGNLIPAGKPDTFRIDLPADGQIDLTLSVSNGTFTWVTLYDKDTTTVLNSNYTDNTMTLSTNGLGAGTYFIRVYPYYGGQTPTYTLKYAMTAAPVANDAEPNNNASTAQTLPINSTTTGHIGYYYDKKRDTSDWYKITLNQDGMLQLKLTSHITNDGRYVWIYLFDNNGTTQLNAAYSDGPLTMNTDGLAAGTYYVRINCYYSDRFSPYTLTDSLFTPLQANDNEPNSNKSEAQILPVNSTVTGHVGYYYDNKRDTSDWYKITLNEDGMLQLKLTSHVANDGRYVWVYLFDNNGNTQLNAAYSDGPLTMNTDGLAAGTYYIRVNCYYADRFSPYTLTDSLITYNPNDPEPNNYASLAGTIPANSFATGHVNFYYNGSRDSHDWWKIDYTDSSGKLKILFSLLPAKSDNSPRYTWLQIFKDTLAAPLYNNYSNQVSTEINLTSLAKAMYYFKVFTYYGDHFSPYAITPFFAGPYVSAGISLISATQGSGCNNNILSYRLSGSTSPYTPYTVKLYKDNVFYDSVVVNRDTVSFSLLPSGTYYATVRGFGAPLNVFATSSTSVFNPVVPAPVPSGVPVITKQGRTLYSSPHGARETYQWFRNGTLISGAGDSIYFATLNGSYTARFANACGSGAASNEISFTSDYQNQTISFPSISDKTFGDADFVLTATSSSGLPVEFAVIKGPASITGNQLHIKGAGTITVEARQQGDDSFGAATPVQRTFSVLKINQNITFAPVSDKEYHAGAFDLIANSSSGLPVSYSVVSGNAAVSGNTLSLTGIGNVTIRAMQPGDSNYKAALPVERTFCVSVLKLNPSTGPISICPSKTATYTSENIPGAIYSWRLAGGSSLPSSTNTVTLTWPSSGNYTLIVRVSANCGTPSKEDSLIVTAITNVQPDSVNTMLPVNGAVNQQLPLTLSWIPASPALYYTYDLYLWKATDPQPSTIYASNLTPVNYTIPVNSGLAYNTTYKWMIAAHNGSCTTINTGPVQEFTLTPLPDLQVFNVAAPLTAFSGQNISVSWKVKNNGPGNTLLNQRWVDAIYISKDSMMNFGDDPFHVLQFPTIPRLVATKQNKTALNSGEQYSDTAIFPLPVDYSGQLYIHVITNYAPGADNPVIETTLLNDTAHASSSATITLSPLPDLRIDTIVNPGNAFSGSVINLTYKVKNYGANATGPWNDKIYISKDPLFNKENAIPLQYAAFINYQGIQNEIYYPTNDIISGYKGILQQDSSYTNAIRAVIPNFIYGTYFIYVVTDSDAQLYEGPNESNNVNHGNPIQVFLTPTPKIVPVKVTVPAAASNTQAVSISWSDQNQGAYDNIEKNKGHYMAPNGTCQSGCENAQPGVLCYPAILSNYKDSLGYGSSYWVDKIYLSTNPSGLDFSDAVYIGQLVHGYGRGYDDQIQPATCGYGISKNVSDALIPGKNLLSEYNYVVPDNLPAGTYYIYVYGNADKTVYEYPGIPQITRSNGFTVSSSDLTVVSVTPPGTGNSGQSLVVNYTILNNGPGAVYNHSRKEYLYLGNSSTFDASALLLDSVMYNSASIPVSIDQKLTWVIKLPNGMSGLKYIFIRTNADGSIKETNYNNNINLTGGPVNIYLSPSPDLIVSSVEVPLSASSSSGFKFSYTVRNSGTGVANGAWRDSLFISCNPAFNRTASYFIGMRTHQDYIPVGGSYNDTFNLAVPQTFLISNAGCMGNSNGAQVYFYVKANADNGIYEDNTGNNIGGSGQSTFSNLLVDHTVTGVTYAEPLAVGRYFKTTWTVKNSGANPNDKTYVEWFDAVYLSPDSVLNANAVLVGVKSQSIRLNHDQSYSDSAFYQVHSLLAGSYYLLVKTNYKNDIPAERNLSNNVNLARNSSGEAVKINITNPPAPDIVPSIVSAPPAVAIGQPVKIVYRIINNGPGATYETGWNDDVWLSNSFRAGGVFLSRKHHTGVLQPGQSYSDSVTVMIPVTQIEGNYTIVVFTNQDHDLYESNYSNNQAYKYVSVYRPAPVDLIVNNISSPDTILLGYPANITWTLLNNSNNSLNGIETDGIYLGKDSLANTVADILIGTKLNQLNMLPLHSVADTARPIAGAVTEGYYYVKVKADILNNIIESNKDNNTGVGIKKVYVSIKVLPVDVLTADILTADYLYYKLTVPASLKGKTIAVRLVTLDSLTVNNQLFVGLGYLPSAAHFDYAFEKPNYGNQQVIIETVVDSVYYIAARRVSQNGKNQNITLQATVLPFSIINVNSNHGGNTGNVTVQVRGTLFRDSMTVQFRRNGNIITASKVYFVNSTTVYATFNLAGASLGLYDVGLQKPDGSSTTLPSGFTIEKTDNGGLLTGGGNNTGQTGSGNAPGCDPGAASGLNSQLQTEIIIPPKVFASWPFSIQINYTNTSNVDIPAQVRILYSLDGAPLSLTEAGLSQGKTALYVEFKDATGPGNIIRAGGSGTIVVYSKAPANAAAHQLIYFNLQ